MPTPNPWPEWFTEDTTVYETALAEQWQAISDRLFREETRAFTRELVQDGRTPLPVFRPDYKEWCAAEFNPYWYGPRGPITHTQLALFDDLQPPTRRSSNVRYVSPRRRQIIARNRIRLTEEATSSRPLTAQSTGWAQLEAYARLYASNVQYRYTPGTRTIDVSLSAPTPNRSPVPEPLHPGEDLGRVLRGE